MGVCFHSIALSYDIANNYRGCFEQNSMRTDIRLKVSSVHIILTVAKEFVKHKINLLIFSLHNSKEISKYHLLKMVVNKFLLKVGILV